MVGKSKWKKSRGRSGFVWKVNEVSGDGQDRVQGRGLEKSVNERSCFISALII